MSPEVGAAVVGVGFIGGAHARAARSAGARLVGVVASTADRSKEAAVALSADRGYPTFEAALDDDDVHVVHLCVPNALHLPMALAALGAGKHVVCEKPLTLDLASADRLLTAQRDAGAVGAVPFVYRFHPLVREMRARVAAGALGRVHLGHGTYLQDWLSRPDDDNWRIDAAHGGASRAFADIGSHWIDLVEFVLGDRVTRLSARFATTYARRSTEDTAVVAFETGQGIVGSVVVSQTAPGRKNALVLEVSGTHGSARFEQEQPGTLWLGGRDATTLVPADAAVLDPDAARQVVVPPGHPQGYLDCVDRFVVDTYAAVRGQAPAGLPTFDDGRRAVAVVDAALRSAAADGDWTAVTA